MTIRRCAGLLLAVALLAAACSSGDDDAEPAESTTPAVTLAPDRDTVLAAAAQVMGEVDTVTFSIERTGAPIYIDPFEILVFDRADGRFAAPSSADAVVLVEAAGNSTRIGAIAYEGQTWLSDPISGRFSRAPGSYGFDPATLFDPDIGWRPLLTDGLTEITWTGLDDTRGEDRYRVSGVADPERLEVITAGLVRDQQVVLDIWIDVATGAVREVEFDTVYEGATSNWNLVFSGYGEPVEVAPPPDES